MNIYQLEWSCPPSGLKDKHGNPTFNLRCSGIIFLTGAKENIQYLCDKLNADNQRKTE